jgi:tetratricopeptide (TPR) repeat protein
VRRRHWQMLVILAAAAAGIHSLGVKLNYQRYSGDVREELMYFPSGRLMEMASVGFRTLASDLLWLKGVQYYGEHRRSDMEYPLAEHIFSTITDLDPQFVGAYRFGAFVLAQDVGQPAAGIELLRKGMLNNPELWQLPFDLGFLYFNSVKDNAKAAHFFRFASRFKDSPDITRRFTAFAYRKAGRTDVALSLWQEIYESSANEVMRETAINAIKRIRLDQMREALGELVEEYGRRIGEPPADLGDLVEAGLAEAIPDDPFGGHYFLDRAAETVLSTTTVSEEAGHMTRYLRKALDRYFHRHGRYPASISALEDEGLVSKIPDVAGARLEYDPAAGTVEYRPAFGK